jgi:hypothetical protein
MKFTPTPTLQESKEVQLNTPPHPPPLFFQILLTIKSDPFF